MHCHRLLCIYALGRTWQGGTGLCHGAGNFRTPAIPRRASRGRPTQEPRCAVGLCSASSWHCHRVAFGDATRKPVGGIPVGRQDCRTGGDCCRAAGFSGLAGATAPHEAKLSDPPGGRRRHRGGGPLLGSQLCPDQPIARRAGSLVATIPDGTASDCSGVVHSRRQDGRQGISTSAPRWVLMPSAEIQRERAATATLEGAGGSTWSHPFLRSEIFPSLFRASLLECGGGMVSRLAPAV